MTPGVPGVRYRIHAVTVGSDIVNLKVLNPTDLDLRIVSLP